MASPEGTELALREGPRSARTSLGRNIVANFVGRAYSLGATYLFVPFYIHILGVEAYGLIAFYAVLLAVSTLADIGLSATFSRQAAEKNDPTVLADLLGTAERLLLLGVAVFAVAVIASSGWLAAHWLRPSPLLRAEEMVGPLRLMAALLVPQMLFSLYSAGLLGLQHQVAANVLQAVMITLRSGLVTVLILWRPDLNVFFAWQIGVTLVVAASARIILLRRLALPPTTPLRFSWPALRPHAGYAGGMLAITAISTVNTQLDKILISRLFTIADFGYYSIASTLAQLPFAVALPIGVAFFPRLVASVANSDKNLATTYGNYVSLVTFAGGLGSVGLALFAPEFLRIWLNAPVAPLLPPLVASLAIGTFLLCLNAPPFYLCLARGRSWTVVAVSLATLSLSVPVLLAGLYSLGLLGGALAWIFLNFINLLLLVIVVERAGAGSYFPTMARAVVGSTLIAAIPLLVARWAATGAELGPWLAGGLAVLAGGLATAMFAVIHRSQWTALTLRTA